MSLQMRYASAASTWALTTSGNWNTSANWNAGAGPVPTSSTSTQLIFGGTTAYTATNDVGAGTFSLNSITLSDTAAVTIAASAAANTLTFGGSARRFPSIRAQGRQPFPMA